MKRNILLTATLILGVTAFAEQKTWTNFLGLGWRLPTSTTITVEGNPSDTDVKFKNVTGLNTFYMGTHKNGLAVKGELNINGTRSDLEFGNKKNAAAVNVECVFGAGFAPVHTDNLYLAIFGTCGGTYFETEEVSKISVEFSNPFVGVDVTSAYTFTNHFSVYGSLGMNLLLPGECKTRNKRLDIDTKHDTKASYAFAPKVGVCWKF